MNKEKGNISIFQKYLSVWVILCMAVGVLIGKYLPSITKTLTKRAKFGYGIFRIFCGN